MPSGLAGGKFENLNRVLAAAHGADFDWLLVVDDDLRLPARFLDRFVGLCEHFELDLAQPAQSQRSHSAWRVTRRRPASLVRETRFVEIGPLTAFGRRAAERAAAVPRRCASAGGSTCTGPRWPPSAAGASAWSTRRRCATRRPPWAAPTRPRDAQAEAAGFLADRPYLPAARAGEVLATHRRGGPLMRLLFVAPDMHRGGAERQWATLIPALAARGAEVRLLCLNDEGPLFADRARRRRAGHLRAPGRARRRARAAPRARRGRGDARAWS